MNSFKIKTFWCENCHEIQEVKDGMKCNKCDKKVFECLCGRLVNSHMVYRSSQSELSNPYCSRGCFEKYH